MGVQVCSIVFDYSLLLLLLLPLLRDPRLLINLLRNCLSHFLFLSNPIYPHEVLNHSLGSNWTQEKQAINKMHWRSIYCFANVKAKLSCNKTNSPMG